MKEKINSRLVLLIDALILAGLIVFLTGLYYWMIKAGIPAQDPPLEVQIEYAVNMGIGEILLAKGFILILGGGILRLFLGLRRKKRQKQ